jgi:hypothetical protein
MLHDQLGNPADPKETIPSTLSDVNQRTLTSSFAMSAARKQILLEFFGFLPNRK